MMPYELFISLRYLQAKRKQAFISLISAISVGGVALGVAALIIVLAVMTGFKNDIRDKILGIMAHILIQKPGTSIAPTEFQEMSAHLRDLQGIVDISPYVSGQLLISSTDNVSGITLHGIDPDRKTAVANLEKNMKEGSLSLLKDQYENVDNPTGPKRDGIIIGWELARILGVFQDDEVTLILPGGRVLPTGPVPKLKKFRVVGIFSSGFYEYDAALAYISLTAAQKFFTVGENISGIEIRVIDIYRSSAVANLIKTRLGTAYTVQDWAEMNKSLFSAINLEKFAMFLILALIVLVAAFNIISTLVMMVMEKQGDIATLKSLGATANSIMKIFMFEGSVIGIIGTTIGTILGVTTAWVADTYKLIPLEGGTYYLNHLPFTVTVLDVSLVVVAALCICFGSTIYPARQASKLDPVVVFRYE
jgi:lipoprotein-releasing system permease protein